MTENCHTFLTEGQQSVLLHQEHLSPISSSFKKRSQLKDELDFINENQSKICFKQESEQQQFENTSLNNIKKSQVHIFDESLPAYILNQLKDIALKIRFKKYAQAFLDLARTRMLKLLTPQQIKMINDKSYWKEDEVTEIQQMQHGLKRMKTLSRFQSSIFQSEQSHMKKSSFILKILSYIPVFLPNSRFVEVWQAIKIVSVLICFFCYLVCFAFESLINQFFRLDMIFACQIFLLLDIFMNLNTGIYVKGILCIDRSKILLHYQYTKAFYYDVASQFFTLSYFIFTYDNKQSRIALSLLLPIVFKYNDINIVIKKMKDRFLLDRKIQNIIELINLLKNILLISHVFACIWILAAKISNTAFNTNIDQKGSDSIANSYYNAQTWIDLMRIGNESWIIQYSYSYYFITVTMITVGYGDIKPTNIIEVIICTFLMMICCVIFGFTINSIGEIFQDFYKQEKKVQEKRYVIGNYMMRKGVARQTMKDVYEYLEYYWKEQSDENQQQEQDIISQLSNGLREELLAESNRIIFKESSIFKENFSYDTLLRCLPIIQEQRCTPEEIIYDAESGDTDIWIYFIQQGELEVYIKSSNDSHRKNIQNKNSTIQKIKEGEQFGEISFFTGGQPKMCLKSLNFSKLLKMKRSDFIKVLMEDKTEYETFCMIKDTIIYSNDTIKIKKKCESCNEYSHDVGTCPRLHIQLNKGKIIGKVLYSIPHFDRQIIKKERNLKYKHSTLENLENNNNRLIEYINDKYEDLIEYEENNLFSTPFSRSNSYFPTPIDIIDSSNQNYQEGLPKDFMSSSNPNNIIQDNNNTQQSNEQTNSPLQQANCTNMNTGANLSSNLNQNSNLSTQLSPNFKQLQPFKKRQIQFKRSQSQHKYHKQHSNMSNNEEDNQSDDNNNVDRQDSMKQRQKVNFERETSIVQQQQTRRNSFQGYSKSVSIQSEAQVGSYSNSQERLMNLKQQLMQRQNAKEVSSLNSLQFKNDLQANLQLQQQQHITSQKQIQIPPLPQQFYENYMKRQFFNTPEYIKLETSVENFDLFLGQFERMTNLVNYFPYYNCKNVVGRLQQKQQVNLLNSKRGSLKVEFTRNLISQNQIKKRRSQLNSQNSILSNDKYKNYQQQRKEQKSKTSAFKIESNLLISQSQKVASLFLIQGKRDQSIIPSQYSSSHQREDHNNIDEFITQENDFSMNKIDPNTPSQSEDEYSRYKQVQNTFIKKSTYDFQCKDMTSLKKSLNQN